MQQAPALKTSPSVFLTQQCLERFSHIKQKDKEE